mmetsp:Transcript_77143/g.249696  ORF Transcript_77143/g.249696 Transcript_77143/m.249696 type:complete len:332 (+) Transcript_77143:90-1085(+)
MRATATEARQRPTSATQPSKHAPGVPFKGRGCVANPLEELEGVLPAWTWTAQARPPCASMLRSQGHAAKWAALGSTACDAVGSATPNRSRSARVYGCDGGCSRIRRTAALARVQIHVSPYGCDYLWLPCNPAAMCNSSRRSQLRTSLRQSSNASQRPSRKEGSCGGCSSWRRGSSCSQHVRLPRLQLHLQARQPCRLLGLALLLTAAAAPASSPALGPRRLSAARGSRLLPSPGILPLLARGAGTFLGVGSTSGGAAAVPAAAAAAAAAAPVSATAATSRAICRSASPAVGARVGARLLPQAPRLVCKRTELARLGLQGPLLLLAEEVEVR